MKPHHLLLFICCFTIVYPPFVRTAFSSHPCAASISDAYLDLVIVVEATAKTLVPSVIFDIVSRLENLAYRLNLSNDTKTGHTSRIALISYDNSGATVHHSLNDSQSFDAILSALGRLRLLKWGDGFGDLVGAFKIASNVVENTSFRAQSILLVAASIDATKRTEALDESKNIKLSGVQIATVGYTEVSADVEFIASLASPGLDIRKNELDVAHFGPKVALLNCRCPSGTTPVTLQSASDSIELINECAMVQDTVSSPEYIVCDNDGTLFSVETEARLDFFTTLLKTDNPDIKNVTIGLKKDSTWQWQTPYGNIPYNDYPPWASPPASTDTYAHLYLENDTWKLYSNDGTDGYPYVCVQKSCDTSSVCELHN
uniref:VWFA domain-containing protein n=1 Tax=Panagrellus redivivus TaxID=6233 RepID=A0A7E4V541_PANRE